VPSIAFTDIYVISLDRRPDRTARFLQFNASVGNIQRFPAIDGRQLNRQKLQTNGLMQVGLEDYTDGALGCAMSHRALWLKSIELGHPITIAEDDAVFHRTFCNKAESLSSKIGDDWDFILWGWNFDSMLHAEIIPGVKRMLSYFDPYKMLEGLATFQTIEFDNTLLPLHNALGLPAYSISPAGAQKLLAACFPLKNFTLEIPGLDTAIPNVGIDVALNKFFAAINAYVCWPPLVVTDNETESSDIQLTEQLNLGEQQ